MSHKFEFLNEDKDYFKRMQLILVAITGHLFVELGNASYKIQDMSLCHLMNLIRK